MIVPVDKALCSVCGENIAINESVEFSGVAVLKERNKKGNTFSGGFEIIDVRIVCQVCKNEEDQKSGEENNG